MAQTVQGYMYTVNTRNWNFRFLGVRMAKPKWLSILEEVGPMVLQFTPLAPIASAVTAGIRLAEALPGTTGQQKQQTVMQIVATAVAGANAQAGKQIMDPAEAVNAASAAIDTIVHVTNVVAGVKSATTSATTDTGTSPVVQ
jgi:hypothetical protein